MADEDLQGVDEQEVHEAAEALGVDPQGKDVDELVDEMKVAHTDSVSSPTGADDDAAD